MNKVELIGRLTNDPDIRQSGDKKIARLTLAVRRTKDTSDFIRCIAFEKTADLIEKYTAKGKMIAVEGNIKTGSYEDKDGKKVYTTDVLIDRIEFLEKGEEKELSTQQVLDFVNSPQREKKDDGFMKVPDGVEDEGLPFN